jgi:hypothetical protein
MGLLPSNITTVDIRELVPFCLPQSRSKSGTPTGAILVGVYLVIFEALEYIDRSFQVSKSMEGTI